MSSEKKKRSEFIELIAFILILLGTYLTSFYSYLLFHTIAELFSIIIAGGIFVIAWNSRKNIDNSFFLIVGISFLFVGFIDLMHTLAYTGMNIFVGYDSNLPTSLWIAARYLQAFSFLYASLMVNRKVNPTKLLIFFTIITTILLSLIFYGLFPVCYVEGKGLTPFKIISEYIINFILLGTILIMYKFRHVYDKRMFMYIIGAIISTMIAELAFTFYVSTYGISNLIGHLFKLIAFFFLYIAIIEIGLENPFRLLFRKLNQTNKELEHEVSERVCAENDLKEFVSIVSHELRTPITVLLQSTSSFKKYGDKLTDEQKNNICDSVSRNAELLAELVKDLLLVSRINEGMITLEIEEYKPLDVISEILELMELGFKEKNIKIKLEIDDKIKLKGDPKRVGQIFRILIDNAIKYSSENSEVLITATDNYNGNFNTKNFNDDGVLFQIIDTGRGIKKEDIPNLFKRYCRSEDVHDIPGTGLGLFIAKEFTELHKGEIFVESKFRKGSTFTVFFPKNLH
jgi:signal transduction histidine kinase